MIIKIGGIPYTVKRVHELRNEANGDRLDGRILPSQNLILIDDELGSLAQLQCLWHELLHGILFQAGITEHNEQVIDLLAYGIVGLLSGNQGKLLP